jgi:hypothetical protein
MRYHLGAAHAIRPRVERRQSPPAETPIRRASPDTFSLREKGVRLEQNTSGALSWNHLNKASALL